MFDLFKFINYIFVSIGLKIPEFHFFRYIFDSNFKFQKEHSQYH